MVDYTIQNKPTRIQGHSRVGLEEDVITYDSQLEAKVGVALIRDRVRFQPHVQYEVFGRDGMPFYYTIDFDLQQPRKLRGIGELVDSVEVKGVLSRKDFDRKDAFEYTHDRDMWIATPALVEYWVDEGIMEHDVYSIKPSQRVPQGANEYNKGL